MNLKTISREGAKGAKVIGLCLALVVTTLTAQLGDGFSPAELAITAPVAAAGGGGSTPEILWWKLNEGSGTALTGDASAGGDDGSTDAARVTGKSGSGSALAFIPAKSDDAVTSSSIVFGTSTITVMGWFYWDDLTGTKVMWEASADAGSTAYAFSCVLYNGAVEFLMNGSAATKYRVETIAPPATGSWQHLAVVYDGSTANGDIKVYLDGVLQSTTLLLNLKDSVANFSTQTLFVASRNTASLFMDGRIDDLRIYSGELTSTQINTAKDDPQ